MKPSSRRFVAVTLATLASAAWLAGIPVVQAGPIAQPSLPEAAKAAVGPLSPAKKLEGVNKVTKALGLSIPAVPPAQMKVTPIAPVHAGGARIAFAAPTTFLGPAPAVPDGLFMLTPPNNSKGEVRLEFPTEKEKFYLLDCRLQPAWGGPTPVSFKRGEAAAQSLNADDGHYLFTFKADQPSQSVKLVVDSGIGFYGCEITKLN